MNAFDADLSQAGLLRGAALSKRLALLAALCVALWLSAQAVQAAASAAGQGLDLTARRGYGQMTLYAVVVAVFCLYVRAVLGYKLEWAVFTYLRDLPKRLRVCLTAACLAAAVGLMGYGFLLAFGMASWSDAAWESLDWPRCRHTLGALGAVAALATTEEVVFRGFIFNHLRTSSQRFGTWLAIVGSAAIFAGCHRFAHLSSWLSWDALPYFVGLFALGVLLAGSYAASGSIACPIGIHFGLLGVERVFWKTKLITLGVDGVVGPTGHVVTAPGFWLLCSAAAWLVWRYRASLSQWAQIRHPADKRLPAPSSAAQPADVESSSRGTPRFALGT